MHIHREILRCAAATLGYLRKVSALGFSSRALSFARLCAQKSEVNYMQLFMKKLKTMLKVDFRRMFTQPLYYIMLGVSVVVPILILVMTTMTGSSDSSTGEQAMQGFTNVWQAIGSVSGQGADAAMAMDITSMCNINLMYFLIAVLVCIFVSDDFRSGYSKNLFTVRSKKTDYVVSKTLVGVVGGVSMIIGYFVGAMLGGAIAGLSFDLGTVTVGQVFACLLSKVFIVPIFVSIFTVFGVVGKQKLWLSILLSLGCGMFLFMMLSIAAPLNAGILNVIMCLFGGVIFAVGLGAVSNAVLNKTSLV